MNRSVSFLVALCLVGTTPLAAVAGTSAGDAPATLIGGRLLNPDGSPAAGVQVTVTAMTMTSATEQRGVVVGRATSDGDGYFEVTRSSPQTARLYELNAVVAGSPLVYDFEPGPTSRLARTSGAGATAPRVVLMSRFGPVDGRPPQTGRVAVVPDRPVHPGRPETDRTPTGFTAATGQASGCASPMWGWTSETRTGWVPLRLLTTRAHSHQRYSWTTTNQTRMDIAVTGTGGGYRGGLVRSAANSDSMSIQVAFGNGTSKMIYAQWRYRKWAQWCAVFGSGGTVAARTGVYKWMPDHATGYSRNVDRTPSFRCGVVGPMSNATTFTRSTTAAWNGWFSIASVRLNSTQTQSTRTSFTVIPDRGERPPRMCASNPWGPYYSARIREVS